VDESLVVGRNFVSGICKLVLKNLETYKKLKTYFFCKKKNLVFTSPAFYGHYICTA